MRPSILFVSRINKALKWKTPYQTVVEAWKKNQFYSKLILVTLLQDHTTRARDSST